MNPIHVLSAQPWVARLGWTLVHFLWQGLLIAAVYAAARGWMGGKASPNTRYLLACAALGAMLAAPLVTWGLMRQSDTNPDDAYRIRNAPLNASTTSAANSIAKLPPPVRITVSSLRSAQFLPWAVIVWLFGASVFWVRLAGGWLVAAGMRSTLVRRAPPEWQQALQGLGARIGVSHPVQLLVSALVQVPTVVGWLRPVVLVPVGALAGLPAEHLEALLLHELAHIRRHDYLVNILQGVAEALLFYHPTVWWVSAHIRVERELCCDDVVVSVSGDALMYARALAQLESYRPAHLHAAVAANGGTLSGRIGRLLGQSPPAGTSLGPGVLAVAILLVAAGHGLFGQSAAPPAFQVASIKRNPVVWSEPTQHPMDVHPEPGGRLTAHNAPLTLLIQRAYAAQAFQVVGGPAWINSPGYDIEAKPESNTNRREMWLMLQTLLADRFKLTLHRETRELPVYNLTAAKRVPRLPEPKEVNCVSRGPDAPTPPPPSESGPVLDCGYIAGPLGDSGLRFEGSQVHMADFIKKLALVLDRPVLGTTGFTGAFDLTLNFTADRATMGLPGAGGPGDPGGAGVPANPDLPNIFAALQEQLGLKLVPAKGPVEVLLVDHVERPTAN